MRSLISSAIFAHNHPLLYMKKILIADDEQDILDILRYNLESEGFRVETAPNGILAVERAKSFRPDLIILDVMMPFKNGVDACRELRQIPEFRQTLIIFLSAMNDEVSEISGLESGADDYLTKPIRPKALISKVQSLFRRVPDTNAQNLTLGNLRINRENFSVTNENTSIVLARKEFELLYLLASKPGKVFLRQEILQLVWGTDVIVGDRTIDVHIRKIRQKLNQDVITTVKGVGYKFELSGL
jgi:two-component system alkaline phosphatase synthesis response regulator PhoP